MDEMDQQTNVPNPNKAAPVRTEAERKKWREEFFQERLKSVSAERIAKIAAMIAPWPGAVAQREDGGRSSGEPKN